MLIWGALLIPIFTAVYLGLRYTRQMTPVEFIMTLGVPMLMVVMINAIAQHVMVDDVEYFGGYVTQARYFEPWDERVHCRHPIFCARSCGKNCVTFYICGYVHAYDVDYHPAEYWLKDSNANDFRVQQAKWLELSKRFGNTYFVPVHHYNVHSINGQSYASDYKGEDSKIEMTTIPEHYVNKVKRSNSVFNFPTVDPKKLQLYNYPIITDVYHQESCLGDLGPSFDKGRFYVDYVNAKLGAKSKARIYVLGFKGRPIQAGFDQRAYWKNGNKNEIVICVGLDDKYKPTWCYAFGWSKLETLKVSIRDMVMAQKTLDLAKLGTYLYKEIEPKIVRRDFREFDYLKVQPPMWVIILTYILTLLACIGIGIWDVENEFNNYFKGERYE